MDGKNLLDAEYDHSMALTGQKYLYHTERENKKSDQVVDTFKQQYKFKFNNLKVKKNNQQKIESFKFLNT